jgi:hypothetical protein
VSEADYALSRAIEVLHANSKDDSWSLTYDCKLQQEILFRIGIHLLPADNPQQAETTSTAGSSATFWCREDDSGGSASHRETDEGYHALYSVSRHRIFGLIQLIQFLLAWEDTEARGNCDKNQGTDQSCLSWRRCGS